MSENRKRAVGYPRVSGAVQEDGTSLDTQAAEMMKLANAMGYQIDPEDILPEVRTGVHVFRPQLDKIRGMAAAGEIDALFVYTTDRLSRDPVDLLVLLREFKVHGVEVYFVQDPSDNSPEGELVNFVRGFSAGREHAMIRERTMRGKRAVARGGRMPVGSPHGTYGYDYDLTSKKLSVNEEEAEVVKRIFRLYVEGWSMFRVAKKLNVEGIPSKSGVFWSVTALRGVLSHTSYIGVDYYGKTKLVRGVDGKYQQVDVPREEWIEIRGYSPVIICEAMFQKAQERLEITQERYRGKNARRYLMTGTAVCGFCGCPISGTGGGGKYRYYRCNGRRAEHPPNFDEAARCPAERIDAAWLEEQVWFRVVAMVRDPSGIITDLELNFQTGGGEIGKEINRLRSEVRKAEQEKVRVFRQYRRGKVSEEFLDAEMGEVSATLEGLRRRLAALEEQRLKEESVVAAGERIRDYCLRVSASLEGLDADGKRALMSRLGVKVVAVKGDLMITAEIDPGFVANEGSSGRN